MSSEKKRRAFDPIPNGRQHISQSNVDAIGSSYDSELKTQNYPNWYREMQELGWKKGDFPKAEEYYSGCISLPMFPTLTDEEQDFVIKCIDRFYG